MSTTVTITPAADGIGVAPLTAAAVSAVASMLGAVLTDDAECKRMLERARQEENGQRLASVRLRTPDLSRLAQSAREANFRVRETKDWVRIDVPGQPSSVWATRTQSGLALAGGAESLRRVLVTNTLSRLSQPLASRGFKVAPVPARAGASDVELLATGPCDRQVRLTVSPSGEATVDALNYHGVVCEEMARDLAAAVDGTVVSYCRKPEYFGAAAVRLGTKQHV